MAEMKISNTLVNDDSSQVIAYARQILDEAYGDAKKPETQSEINKIVAQLRKDLDSLIGSSGSVDDAINTFKEIEDFLKDYKDGDTLTTVLENFIKPYKTTVEALDTTLNISLDDTTGNLIAKYGDSSNLSDKSRINPKTGAIELVFTF